MAEELERAGSGGAGGADIVTTPDQHRRPNLKWTRIGSVIAIIAILLMTQPFNNHNDWVADAYLIATAGVIALFLGVDAVLRRNGLRR